MVLFLNRQARDSATGDLADSVRGQTVTICEVGTTTPVAITEHVSGASVPGSVLTVGNDYTVPSFNTPDGVFQVDAVASNGARSTLESVEGAVLASQDSATSAAASANEAADAASRSWNYPAAGVMRPPSGSHAIFPTMTAALAAGAAIGGFQTGDMVYIEDPES